MPGERSGGPASGAHPPGHWAVGFRSCKLLSVVKRDALLARVLSGISDAQIPFRELRSLLRHLGFDERIRGSHHIFTKDGVEEILNLQPKGRNAKPYQVKQVRGVLVKYRLAGGNDEK